MRDPERFVTFVLGAFAVAFYLTILYQIARVWRRIGHSPLPALSGPWSEKLHLAGAFSWPLLVLAWSYCPRCFEGLPRIAALENWPARLAGLLCLCLGASILWTSLLELGDSWRIGNDPAAPATFIRTGIYSSVRHPIYGAAWLCLLGIFLMAPTLLFALLWSGGSTVLLLQTAREERFLSERLGKPYLDYMKSTGRFFPLWF